MSVARVEPALVANAFVEAIAAFDPKLDRLEPHAESTPEIGPSQATRGGLRACELRGALLERGRVRQRPALLAAPRVDLARHGPRREIGVALGFRRAHDGPFETHLPSELVPIEHARRSARGEELRAFARAIVRVEHGVAERRQLL